MVKYIKFKKRKKVKIMTTLDNVGQKLTGKVQQIKGKIEVASGQHIKGNIDKLRGKANEFEADVKMKVEDSK
jgi:uncharacterized protein YjbJ (UPF0337 family)